MPIAQPALQLDPLTLLFAIACMALLMGGVSFTLARAHPEEDHGLSLWGCAMAAGGGAFMLISMRGQLSLFTGFVLANLLVVAVPVLGALALARLVQSPPPMRLLLGLATWGYGGVLTVAVFEVERRLAAGTMATALAGLLAVCAGLVLRQPRAHRRASSWVMTVMMGTMALAFALRALVMVLGTTDASPTSASRMHIGVLLLGGAFINGASLGFFFMVQDRLRLQAQERARRDPLTGLYTRGGFHELVGSLCPGPDSSTCAVLMLDVDRFKLVNDTHGHAAGDRLLADLGMLISDLCGDQHLASRHGGEEFCLVLRDTPQASAGQFSARLVAAAAERALPLPDGSALRYTVSVGYTMRRPQEPLESAIERADAGLYVAKRSGRNRACLAPTGDEPPAPPARALAKAVTHTAVHS